MLISSFSSVTLATSVFFRNQSRARFACDGDIFFLPRRSDSSKPRSSMVSFCDDGPPENHSGSSSRLSPATK
jgi:hypothetical protein